ncbi:Oxidative stress-induced growth inhibitor 2 [Podila humilis]|nr:Oxidative stress-induced growth inhibitor 2 [Podila humilis]
MLGDYVQLTNHIQHQLAEAGRDANPISAMFDSLAHPHLDTHRGEYPSFLKWRSPATQGNASDVHGNSPTHTFVTQSSLASARPHIVLGRGQVGGIWADMDHDHNQTLSYSEHMELPLYSFTDFMLDHPEYDQTLERPLRSTVSAYYQAYVCKTGISANFSNFTVVTAVYHLKDLPEHCCCPLDPLAFTTETSTSICRKCCSYRYAVLGYIDHTLPPGTLYTRKKTKFLVRCKTLILATGTFDQPKKLAAVSAHPFEPAPSPTSMIQQTFHDCRQLEEWMARHDPTKTQDLLQPMSPPPSPSPISFVSGTSTLSTHPKGPLLKDNMEPIIIVGTGLSAADAILLIQETQPWRKIIHIYRHYTSSEPSPLKRCHRDVYPEYNSVWLKMKKSATLKNAVHLYPRGAGNSVFGKLPVDCAHCHAIQNEERKAEDDGCTNKSVLALCTDCSYRGLPDASISSFDPLTGEAVLILSHGVVIKEKVAAVGVFIGKEVHMGFLKGSLAQDMLSTSGYIEPLISRIGRSRRRRASDLGSSSSDMDVLTPPCTPPRSPVLKPKKQFWHKQALKCAQALLYRATFPGLQDEVTSVDAAGSCTSDVNNNNSPLLPTPAKEETEDEEDEVEPVQQSQVLTLLRPLVSDMFSFRIMPANETSSRSSPSCTPLQAHTQSLSSSVRTARPKKCTRLPCLPVRPSENAEISGAPSTTTTTTTTTETQATVAALAPSLQLGSTMSSCISMPCSPLLGSRRIVCPSLSIPPLLTLCASAASASIAAAVSTVCPSEKMISTSPSSPVSSVASQASSLCSSVSSSASSSTTSLLLSNEVELKDHEHASSSSLEKVYNDAKNNVVTCCNENYDSCIIDQDEHEREKETTADVIVPLMDQSLYAAGAVTGSKFVRYVLGNGMAIVADILKSE